MMWVASSALALLLGHLPRRHLALGGAVERALAPCARLRAQGAAYVALASRLEDGHNDLMAHIELGRLNKPEGSQTLGW